MRELSFELYIFLLLRNFGKYKFLNSKVQKKSVLIVEYNWSHGETLPSLYRYFSKLGFHTDFLVCSVLNKLKPLACVKGFKGKIFSLSQKRIKSCLKSEKIKKYDCVFFNSFNSYVDTPNGLFMPNIFEDFKDINKYNNNLAVYIHHSDLFNESYAALVQPFVLKRFDNSAFCAPMLNPHYFGAIKQRNKNSLTNFITVGALEKKRRNFDLLINAVQSLLDAGVNDFKIIVIGRGNPDDLPRDIVKYFDIKGRVKYPRMYYCMRKADFFLPLLDPDIKEHKRYVTTGTSGSFQLIYGFLKPPVIHCDFAQVHGFNPKNSIIYEKNDSLASAMQKAIEMNKNDYNCMRDNIKMYARDLDTLSLKNLEKFLLHGGSVEKP